MIIANRKSYEMKSQQEEIRSRVLAGLEQIKEGKTRDFNEVCAKIEKKYMNGTIK